METICEIMLKMMMMKKWNCQAMNGGPEIEPLLTELSSFKIMDRMILSMLKIMHGDRVSWKRLVPLSHFFPSMTDNSKKKYKYCPLVMSEIPHARTYLIFPN